MKRRPSATFVAGAGLTLCAALLSPLPAAALDVSASDHAKRGRVAYDLRDWASAASEYRLAYAAEQNADYLFGLAQALRQSGDYANAIYTFRAYKRLEGVSAQQLSAADLLIGKCEAEKARSEESQAEARVPPPSPSPVDPPPGSMPLAPRPAQPPLEAAAAPAFYEDVLGDGLFIAGLAAAGVGAGVLLNGNSKMQDSAARETESAAHRAADTAHRSQIAGSLLLPVGGVLVTAAVWRWLSAGSDPPRAVDNVAFGPGYIGYSGQF
jgi:hypothetical protein